MKGVVAVVSLAAVLLFTGTAMAQTKVVVVPLGGKKPAGDAVAAEVLEGRTFSNKDEVGLDGAMVNNGAQTFVPGTASQTVPEGYHNGSGSVAGEANLLPGNIKTGATIFGVSGASIEASGTATADQVLAGQTFSNASGSATGAMTNVGAQSITPGTAAQGISQGYHNGSGSVAGEANLLPGNIRSGVDVFGVVGATNVVNTGSGDAAADEILSGKKAWVDGVEVTGTVPAGANINGADGSKSFTITDGLYSGNKTATANDADLLAQNIKSGTTIFGVTGTLMPPVAEGTVTSAGQVWMNRNLGASRAATSLTDTYAYGDLYQWGRLADGHQSRTSLTTSTLSTTDVPGHGSFILPSSPYDWRSPQNGNLWQGGAGTNNPCPAGFRLPTDVELDTERASWSTQDYNGAFSSPLKLVPAGYRYYYNGALYDAGSYGNYWSSTVNGSNSRYLYFYSRYADIINNSRAHGFSVRCLKD